MKTFREEWEKISEAYYSPDHIKEIESARNTLLEKPFILYGAGVEGIEFAKILKYGGISPLVFCDKNKTGINRTTGIPIIAPGELLSEYKDAKIIISSSLYSKEIEDDLAELGVDKNRLLDRKLLKLQLVDLCRLTEKEEVEEILLRNHYLKIFKALNKMINGKDNAAVKGCADTYDSLEDERSKKVFIDYLRLCLLAQPVKHDPLHDQYFDPVINLTKNEVFADCGAYTGDTAENFMERVDGEYDYYYAFEPEEQNLVSAFKFFKDKRDYELVKKGVWDENTVLYFSENYANSGSMQTITSYDANGDYVEVTSLDSFFKDKDTAPTIIKMDIEGSELKALKGAEQIIKENKPKLAVCIYHKPEDLYEIPAYIKSLRDDYKLYVRLYTDTFSELVLYAV